MGLRDRVQVVEGVDLPNFPGDPTAIDWQTRDLAGLLETYRLTPDGRLEKLEQEHVEERRSDSDDPETYDHARGSLRRQTRVVDEEWVDTERHGTFAFYANVDDTRWRYEARFTDGSLDEFVLLAPRGD